MIEHQKNPNSWVAISAIFGLSGVALGAVAAHALSDLQAIAAIEKAALYQLIHALALLIVSKRFGRCAVVSSCFFVFGILLFCGSIELKYLLGLQQATVVAPAGGICLMLGWLFLGLSSLPKKYPPL